MINMDKIIELFEKMGIKLVIEEDGEVKLFDIINNSKMNVKFFAQYLPSNPQLSLVSESPNIENVESYINLNLANKIAGSNSFLNIDFSLKKSPVQRKNSDIVLGDMRIVKKLENYEDITEFNTMNGCSPLESSYLTFTNQNNKNNDFTKIVFDFAFDYIEVEKNGAFGYIIEGKYSADDSSLAYEEMIEIINSNPTFINMANYYAKLFPNTAMLLNSVSSQPSIFKK